MGHLYLIWHCTQSHSLPFPCSAVPHQDSISQLPCPRGPGQVGLVGRQPGKTRLRALSLLLVASQPQPSFLRAPALADPPATTAVATEWPDPGWLWVSPHDLLSLGAVAALFPVSTLPAIPV